MQIHEKHALGTKAPVIVTKTSGIINGALSIPSLTT